MKSFFSPLPKLLCQPLCTSGAMSLAGVTAGRSVACEVGQPGTSSINMNQANVRSLGGRVSGCVRLGADFYGKARPGQVFGGGYLLGAVSSPANYYLIVSPNATGCACCCWKTTRVSSGATSLTDGYLNTYSFLNTAEHSAGNFTATRSINGFSDWYLPAKDELNIIYTNKNTLPAGQEFFADDYWSSTQRIGPPGFCACLQDMGSGTISQSVYTTARRVRAIRRSAF